MLTIDIYQSVAILLVIIALAIHAWGDDDRRRR